MKAKNVLLLIIIAAIALIGLATAYVLTDHTSYTNLTLNGMTCEVPNDNMTPLVDNPEYQSYNDPKCNLTILVFTNTSNYTAPPKTNNTNNTTTISTENLTLQEQQFIKIKTECQHNITTKNEDNVTFNKSSNGIYSYYHYDNETRQNIIIKTNNKKVLIHILQTLKIDPSIKVDSNNNVNMTESNNTTIINQSTTTKNTPQVTNTKNSKPTTKSSSSDSNSKHSSSSSSSHSSSGSHSGGSSSSGGSSGSSSGGSSSSGSSSSSSSGSSE